MTHRGIGLGSVPMALTRLDLSDVTDLDLKSIGFGGDPPAARGDDQNLIAIMNMPARVASFAEVHNAAIEILRLTRLDDGLAGAMHGPGISIRRFGRARRGDLGDILQRDNLHDTLSLVTEFPAVPSARGLPWPGHRLTDPAREYLAFSGGTPVITLAQRFS